MASLVHLGSQTITRTSAALFPTVPWRTIFNEENAAENVVCKMAAISFRFGCGYQCSKYWPINLWFCYLSLLTLVSSRAYMILHVPILCLLSHTKTLTSQQFYVPRTFQKRQPTHPPNHEKRSHVTFPQRYGRKLHWCSWTVSNNVRWWILDYLLGTFPYSFLRNL